MDKISIKCSNCGKKPELVDVSSSTYGSGETINVEDYECGCGESGRVREYQTVDGLMMEAKGCIELEVF